MKKILPAASLMLATAGFAQRATVAPGVRSVMLAHIAPDFIWRFGYF